MLNREKVIKDKKGFAVEPTEEYKAKQSRELRMKDRKIKKTKVTIEEIYDLLIDLADRQSEIYDLLKDR